MKALPSFHALEGNGPVPTNSFMYYVDLPKLKDELQSLEKMLQLIATGRVKPETLICPWGEEEWIPCATIAELRDSLPEQPQASVSAALPAQIDPETRPEKATATELFLEIIAWLSLLCIVPCIVQDSGPWAFICIGTAITCFWMGKVLSYLRQILDKLK